jgi:hypothetical protein
MEGGVAFGISALQLSKRGARVLCWKKLGMVGRCGKAEVHSGAVKAVCPVVRLCPSFSMAPVVAI